MQEPGTHKLTEAMQGHEPTPIDTAEPHGPADPKGQGSTPQEIAENARRQQEARSDGTPDRDEKLTKIGRGQQTHG